MCGTESSGCYEPVRGRSHDRAGIKDRGLGIGGRTVVIVSKNYGYIRGTNWWRPKLRRLLLLLLLLVIRSRVLVEQTMLLLVVRGDHLDDVNLALDGSHEVLVYRLRDYRQH